MKKPTGKAGIRRRELVAALGAAAVAPLAVDTSAQPVVQLSSWDIRTDVLVAGSGAAGATAAIEARKAGARVLVIESLPKFGGSSAMSAGVVYAGGGTALQRALGVQDSIENMYRFITLAGGPHPQEEKVRLYCEDSPAPFRLVAGAGS